MSAPREWYRVRMAADDPTVAEIAVFDMIGDWIDDWIGWGGVTTAKTFGEELAKLSDGVKTIRVRINSSGGDVFSAVTIANLLRDQQKSKGRTVETIVDGLAASAASIIAMGGSTVTMADNALMMIHDPWTCACGNAADLQKVIQELDTVTGSIVATYQWHSTLEAEKIAALMDETTWMNADEAIARGFATAKVEGLKAAASLDRRAVAKLTIPDAYRARVEAFLKPEATPAEPLAVLAACRDGGCLELAEALIADRASLDQVQARIAAASTEKAEATRREAAVAAAAQARSEQITSACTAARVPELAASYIAGGMSLDQVKAQLLIVTAKLDVAEIDGGLRPDQGGRPKARIDTLAVYAQLNGLTKE